MFCGDNHRSSLCVSFGPVCVRVQLSWSTAMLGIPLLFFFIVFYNNNSYQRFYTLYGHTVGMGARLMNVGGVRNAPHLRQAGVIQANTPARR